MPVVSGVLLISSLSCIRWYRLFHRKTALQGKSDFFVPGFSLCLVLICYVFYLMYLYLVPVDLVCGISWLFCSDWYQPLLSLVICWVNPNKKSAMANRNNFAVLKHNYALTSQVSLNSRLKYIISPLALDRSGVRTLSLHNCCIGFWLLISAWSPYPRALNSYLWHIFYQCTCSLQLETYQ